MMVNAGSVKVAANIMATDGSMMIHMDNYKLSRQLLVAWRIEKSLNA